MGRTPKSGEFYRHFKNKLYQIITVAEHSEDGQKLVIYQALYGDFKTYARPLEMFISEVDHEKYPNVQQKYRFERVEFATEVLHGEVSKVAEGVDAGINKAADSKKAGGDEAGAIEAGAAQVVNAYEAEKEADIEEAVEPGLIAFLDTDNWDEKYNILVSLRDKMTDKLVDDFAVVMDVVIPEGTVDARYEQLKICVRTRQKFESQHLR